HRRSGARRRGARNRRYSRCGEARGRGIAAHANAGRSVDDLHHARTQAVPLYVRRFSRAHLQAEPRGSRAGSTRRIGQAAQAIRLDPRDRVPLGERPLCRGAAQLEGAETHPASVNRAMNRWPALPLAAWRDTCATLHMYAQVIGKLTIPTTPLLNHYWSHTFHFTSRGLTTLPMNCAGR